jgi:CubicO group peptidase (beta-lactamase class C family)
MPRGTVRTAVLTLLLALTVGCTSSADSTEEATGPPERDYWPTDEWRTADPADHGFDADEIAEIERYVSDAYTNVRSIAIVRDGYLIYERYWQGFDADDGHDVRSVTKSVMSALVGIALADGAIDSVDQPVAELLPEDVPADADPGWENVTLRHLLSMTSGLPFDDDQMLIAPMWESPDWVRYILGQPLGNEPGTKFAYSDASSHLLSAIVVEATGRSTLTFARERLFEPLGIATDGAFEPGVGGPPTPDDQALIDQYTAASVAWPRDPQGYHIGYFGLKLPTRDLARFGYLFLNEGRWEDRQVIPAQYVRDSTSLAEGTTEYGWQWWVPDEEGAFFARGAGGQTVYVHPRLDLVAVVTSDPETPKGNADDLVEFAILPAAED